MLKKSPTAITIERDDLNRALIDLSYVVEPRTTLPILECVKIEPDAGGIRITGCDLSDFLSIVVPGEMTGPAICVDHKSLKRQISGFRGPMTMQADGVDAITGTNAGVRFKLAARDPVDFPKPDASVNKVALATNFDDCETFGWALERCTPAISTEETRYYLNGISMGFERRNAAEIFRCVATDGHKLVRCWLPEAHSLKGASTADAGAASPKKPRKKKAATGTAVATIAWTMHGIVPRKACRALLRLLQRTEGRIDIKAHSTDNAPWFTFQAGNWTLVSRTIDGTFPDYNRVIPQASDVKTTVTLPLDELQMVLAGLNGIARPGNAVPILVEVGAKDVTLTARSFVREEETTNKQGITSKKPIYEEATAMVDATIAGPKVKIALSRTYLLDLIDGADETVALHIVDPASPCFIGDADEPDLTQVVMPMRW